MYIVSCLHYIKCIAYKYLLIILIILFPPKLMFLLDQRVSNGAWAAATASQHSSADILYTRSVVFGLEYELTHLLKLEQIYNPANTAACSVRNCLYESHSPPANMEVLMPD